MFTNKDFKTMKAEVGQLVGDTSSTFATHIGNYLNKRYRDCVRRFNWVNFDTTTTITTVANQATYALPMDFGRAVYVWDNTNKVPLTEKKSSGGDNDTSLTGTPQYYEINETSVASQPTSASVITFASTSSSDTTQVIFVKGTSGGVEKEETVTLNGSSNVTTTNTYTAVTQISKSATTVGTVTATSNSGAVVLATIQPKLMQVRYRILRLFYIPNSVISIVVRYKRNFTPMINDYDYPVIDVADEIMLGAEADAWRAKRMFQKANNMEQQFEIALNKRMFEEEKDRDVVIDITPYDREITWLP